MHLASLMLLGSGELGREFAIAAKRLGCKVIACDRYAGAPAMQLADAFEVFSMLDGAALREAVEKHRPDVIVPEIEAIDTATLARLESEGWRVAPSARAVQLTMNRDGIRDFAAQDLGLRTSRYRFAESRDEAIAAADPVGLPCVVKPVMSSSGKGQSTAATLDELGQAWDYAVANMRGDRPRVIVEEYIAFDSEITLLTVATAQGVLFCPPVGHRQEHGDYRESWQPAAMPEAALQSAREQAKAVVEALGGHGIFGVEFFVRGEEAIFSELSPRPHDTGMVTLISQSPNEFELHLRAILGLPIPAIELSGPSASAVILADRDSESFAFEGVGDALALGSAGRTGRCPAVRQAENVEPAADGRCPGARSERRGCHRAGDRGRRQGADPLRRVKAKLSRRYCVGLMKERAMRSQLTLMLLPVIGLAACQAEPQQRDSEPRIAVRSAEQEQLHKLNAEDRAIALKRAIQASGFRCARVEQAGFVQKHENLDMWTASCAEGRQWAIYAGPDGSAQVRDCVDVEKAGLPKCTISAQPETSPAG